MFSESGENSTVRIVTFMVVAIFMGVWAYTSVIKQQMQPIDIEQLGIIIAVLTAKVMQKNKEVRV